MAAFLKRENIMLAHPIAGEGDRRIAKFHVIALETGEKVIQMFEQPKLNGERCRVEWFHGDPVLISSYGNEFKFLEHWKDQLQKLALIHGTIPFDGEAYKHGWSRERIHSAISRKVNKNTDTKELEFHIFDYQNFEEQQWQRLRKIGEVEQTIVKTPSLISLKIVPYSVVNDKNWMYAAEDHLENGYEGIILRNPFGMYDIKRTPDLLKFKPTEEDEYTILSVNEAISKDGDLKGMVGSFTVTSPTEPGEVVFDVGAGKMNHMKRIAYWKIREQLVGKTLVVKHELLRTVNKVPIAAVALSVKEVPL
jgi:ATP-dependent DNA ligase